MGFVFILPPERYGFVILLLQNGHLQEVSLGHIVFIHFLQIS